MSRYLDEVHEIVCERDFEAMDLLLSHKDTETITSMLEASVHAEELEVFEWLLKKGATLGNESWLRKFNIELVAECKSGFMESLLKYENLSLEEVEIALLANSELWPLLEERGAKESVLQVKRLMDAITNGEQEEALSIATDLKNENTVFRRACAYACDVNATCATTLVKKLKSAKGDEGESMLRSSIANKNKELEQTLRSMGASSENEHLELAILSANENDLDMLTFHLSMDGRTRYAASEVLLRCSRKAAPETIIHLIKKENADPNYGVGIDPLLKALRGQNEKSAIALVENGAKIEKDRIVEYIWNCMGFKTPDVAERILRANKVKLKNEDVYAIMTLSLCGPVVPTKNMQKWIESMRDI